MHEKDTGDGGGVFVVGGERGEAPGRKERLRIRIRLPEEEKGTKETRVVPEGE